MAATEKRKTLHPTWFTPVWPQDLTRPEARHTEIDAGLDVHVSVEQVMDGIGLGLGSSPTPRSTAGRTLHACPPNRVRSRVTQKQLDLLHAVEPLLMLVGVTAHKDRVTEKDIRRVVYPDCGRWLLIAGGSVPKRCTMTITCGGTTVSIFPATANDQPAFDQVPGLSFRDVAASL